MRGQRRVTFAYLVSRVTRKKLSSGASIQLGRLLRIITPPRVLPLLLLLRPLYWKGQNVSTHESEELRPEEQDSVPAGLRTPFPGSLQEQNEDS